ncbi:14238_t:CDS:2, partial [Funneliformis geosporum]
SGWIALWFVMIFQIDSFRGHLVNSVKQKLDEVHTNMAVIPKGLTSKLQPLDIA